MDDSLVEELAWALPDIERHVQLLGPCPQRPVRIPVCGGYLSRSQETVVSPASDDSLRYPASLQFEACCPVCLDELKHRDGRARASCGNCGNELHLKCYTQLVMNREPGTVGVACPMCRQGFDLPGVQEIALMRSLQSTEVANSEVSQPDSHLDQIVHRLQAHHDALQQIMGADHTGDAMPRVPVLADLTNLPAEERSSMSEPLLTAVPPRRPPRSLRWIPVLTERVQAERAPLR